MNFKKLVLCITILLCVSILVGCTNTPEEKKELQDQQILREIEPTPEELEKKKLLWSIDKWYENPEAHYELGRIYQKQGLLAQAEHEYSLALSFDPVHREAQASMVKVLIDTGDTQGADTSMNFYLNQARGSAIGSLKLGLMLQEYGLNEYAIRCYEQALALAPNSARICRQIGYYHLSKGNNVLAQEFLRRSFQLDSNQPDVARQLGKMGIVVEVPQKKEKNVRKLNDAVDNFDEK